jgi:PAS domain S-box-containing protein
VIEKFDAHQKGMESAPFEYVLITKEGQRLHTIQTTRLITFNGETAILGILTDITERKRTEEAIRKSEQQFRLVWENSADGMRLTNEEGRILLVNEAFCRMVGKGSSELEGKSLAVIYGKERQEHVARRHKERFMSRTVETHLDREISLWNGRKIWVEVTNSFLEFEGQPALLLGIFRDITERKHAEEAVAAGEASYRGLFNGVGEAIYVQDRKGRFLDVNSTAERMYGYSRETLIGKTPLFVSAPGRNDLDKVGKMVERAFAGESQRFEFWGRRANGEIFPKEVRLVRGTYFGQDAVIASADDITERKRAEEANTLLAQTLKSAQDCISITDLNDKILFVNDAFLASYGYNEEDLIGKNIAMVRPASISPLQVGEILPSTLKGHWHGELVNRRKDGTEFPIELWTSVVNDGAGHPIAAVGVARDITERKRADEELKRSHEKFRELFDNAPVGYHELDATGTITNVNLTELQMLGFTLEEMVGRPVWEFAGGGELSRKRVLDKLAGVVPPNNNAERMYRRKDGTTIPVLIDESLLRNQRGEVSGIRTVIQDITEKKRAEGSLRQSEEKYRSLFEESKDVIYISTPKGKLLDINPAGVELLGYNSKEEMLQIEIAHDLFVDPRQREVLQQLMEDKGFIRNYEEVLRRKDGKKITVLDTATAVRDAEGRTILFRGIMRNVTKEKQLEEELTQIQKLESIGTLASGIAHDFNNILGIILGYSTLIERIADDPEKLSQSIQSINAAVQRGASLVKQILTFARKAEVVFGPIDVNVMIKEIVKMLRETFPKTIEMSVQLDKELPFIIADATQLHQVLLNMSVNARDAMPIGGKLSFKTEVATGLSLRDAFPDVPDGDYAHIIITDTGVGMDDTTRAHIFDPFFTTKEKGKGTGLGLSVVYGVMKNHNGFIDVHSEPGKGTTFDLYFPIPEESLRATGKQAEIREEIRGGTETILVVEDEEALLTMLRVVLGAKGYHALTAVDGLEALALYRKHKDEIALVMTDVGLPKISGDQLFFELKKVNPSVRVVLMSGYLDAGLKSEIFKAGVQDFVQKPYDPNEVLRKVREAIDRK